MAINKYIESTPRLLRAALEPAKARAAAFKAAAVDMLLNTPMTLL